MLSYIVVERRKSPMTDEVLLSEIKKNPSKGFDLLLNEYSAFVFRLCRTVLGSVGTKEDAQECASDVFAAFYRNLEKIDLSKGSIKGFLAFGAKHAAVDRYRKLLKEKERTVPLENSENIFDGVTAFESSEKKERSRLVSEAIRSLGEPDCTIILRKFFFGETAKQIGERVSLSAENVQKRSQRALAKLRELLEKNEGGVLLD